MTRFIFGVYGFTAEHRFQREPIATFFDHSDATDFALHPERDGFEKRNCFIDEGQYDRREFGYRPAATPSGYAARLADLDPKPLGNGRFQVAA